MLVVFNILFELITNYDCDDDTLVVDNGLDIHQLLVVHNNKQRLLVAHTSCVEQKHMPLSVWVEPQLVGDEPQLVGDEPQLAVDKLRLVVDKLQLVVDKLQLVVVD